MDRARRYDEGSSSSSRTSNRRSGCSLLLKGMLNPQRNSIKQSRETSGAIPKDRQELDVEEGYPSMIETEVMILPTIGMMEDASSVSYEGFQCVRFPSLISEGTETDGSFRTAPMMPDITSMSIGTGNFGSCNDQDFLTCREGSDQFSTGSLFADARSFVSAHRDSDGDSFYTCRRFNDQGLRSVLAVPTNVNTEQAFNIPLHVFAQSIAEANRKQTEGLRNRLIWRPVKVMSFLAVFAAAVASAILLSRGKQASEANRGADSQRPNLTDAVLSTIPSMAPSILSLASPSIAPWVDDSQRTLSPTFLVLTTGNFKEIDDFP